ncbi:hypothetical protein A3J61_02305 [Candidatus Nomurabacteria bacterium RIFCSPHIGHO2_02_FULL_38_15]|uniref:Transport permease protein n=1 Tax=Candidatus Nomurabacteria bacterium RIFCSPHIGHO2_02_FULL_38_15 TaxID=1801752 RepID=A0A1F6VQ80_9BACT|nr:MAG: hypothetical protein A3J61_02305 [Candidatus Nomurabacteria bacterium RIFCSPHIGHO2_02_FULL_38_15]
MNFFKNIWHYRELVYTLSRSYIIARYKQTILGVGWALIPPILLGLTILFAFPGKINITPEMQPYALFVFVGFWLWALFSNALTFAVNSLVSQGALVRKAFFPRELLVVASIAPIVLDFLIGFIVILVLLMFYKIKLTLFWLLIPFLVLFYILLIISVGLLGAMANVAFRDFGKSLTILLQVLFFVSPVIYSFTSVPAKYAIFYKLNPLTGLIEAIRTIIINGHIIYYRSCIYSIAFTILLLILASNFFKRGEKVIADII